MKVCGGKTQVWLHSLGINEWSVSIPSRFTAGKITSSRYGNSRLDGLLSRSGTLDKRRISYVYRELKEDS
jgi:hypothetical protein